MKWAHDMILQSMHEILACFEGGSSEVKRERRALIAQTDNSIEVSRFRYRRRLYLKSDGSGPNRSTSSTIVSTNLTKSYGDTYSQPHKSHDALRVLSPA